MVRTAVGGCHHGSQGHNEEGASSGHKSFSDCWGGAELGGVRGVREGAAHPPRGKGTAGRYPPPTPMPARWQLGWEALGTHVPPSTAHAKGYLQRLLSGPSAA